MTTFDNCPFGLLLCRYLHSEKVAAAEGARDGVMDLAVTGFRFLLGFVFLASSIPKLAAPDDFSRAVANYRLVPPSLAAPVARVLPLLELGCALALLIGVGVPHVALVVGALLLAFATAVAVNLGRGRTIDCGCRGAAAPRRISWPLVARDVGLAAVAAALVAHLPDDGARLFAWPTLSTGPIRPQHVLAVAVAAATAVFVDLLLEEAWRIRKQAARVAPLLSAQESP